MHAVAPPVAAAVADVRDVNEARALEARHGDRRRSHAAELVRRLRDLEDVLVRFLERRCEAPRGDRQTKLIEIRFFGAMPARLEEIRDGRRGERARHVARVVAARAVGQDEQRQIRTQEDRVLVVLPDFADVGSPRRRHLER